MASSGSDQPAQPIVRSIHGREIHSDRVGCNAPVGSGAIGDMLS
jgi:hypothetical protein